MRKAFAIAFIIMMLFSLSSCENANLSAVDGTNSNAPNQDQTTSTDISGNVSPSPEQSQKPVNIDNKEREKIFSDFLSDNYQKISDSFFSGISGIGFIDLDQDGGIEMVIFDAGASAAMGVQFFDIIDNNVECVSANMEAVGQNFGGEHFSSIVVNANYFDDFRLMEDKVSGEKFFIVESGNGAADFSYKELIRFGNDNGILTLESLMYKHEDYDIDTGNTTGQRFKINGKDAGKAEYDKAYKDFYSGIEDTGYEAKGVFMWENADYASNYKGFMAMVNQALSLYDKQTNS